MQTTLPLFGLVILVVEDNPLIAFDIAETLTDAGAVIAGPCANVKEALAILAQIDILSSLSGAVLDVDLGEQTSVEIARRLQDHGIPFFFHTGVHSNTREILKNFEAPVVGKPSTGATLIASIATLCRSGTDD